MNAKKAREIIEHKTIYCDVPSPLQHHQNYSIALGFIEATKAAEPLLEEILRLSQAVNQFIEPCVEQACEHGKLKREADLSLGKQALSSSAKVVEDYRRKHLGEE